MKKNTLTLLEYENSNVSFEEQDLREFRILNKLYFPKSDGERGILNLISKDRIQATSYVGFIKTKNHSIQILPKIFGDQKSEIIKNLIFLLSYTKKIKIKETEMAFLKNKNDIFEIFIYLFGKNLLEKLKKDLFQNYKKEEDNKNFLKGKLLFNEHIKKNSFNKSKFYTQFDEFLEDNFLNQVFKATVSKLLKLTSTSSNFKLLSECDLVLNNVSLIKINFRDTQNFRFNRLNKIYEEVFGLAVSLLFGNSYQLVSDNLNSYSFVFDMNDLFEEFIFEFMKNNFGDKFKIRSENPQFRVFIEQPFFNMKPDITIYDDKNCKVIIDTKYKHVNSNPKEKYGVKRDDVYQMFIYSQFYKCKNIVLLYPKNYLSDVDVCMNSFFDKNFSLYIKTVDLHKDLFDKEVRKQLLNDLEKLIEL